MLAERKKQEKSGKVYYIDRIETAQANSHVNYASLFFFFFEKGDLIKKDCM